DTFWRTTSPHHRVDPTANHRGRDARRQISVADQSDTSAGLANVGDELLVTRSIEHDDHQILDLSAQRLRDRTQVVLDRSIQVHHVARAGSDNELLHVDIWRM